MTRSRRWLLCFGLLVAGLAVRDAAPGAAGRIGWALLTCAGTAVLMWPDHPVARRRARRYAPVGAVLVAIVAWLVPPDLALLKPTLTPLTAAIVAIAMLGLTVLLFVYEPWRGRRS